MKNDKNLRIAFIGAHGTGKTTLAAEIAKELDLPLIAEGVREKIKTYEKNEIYLKKYANRDIGTAYLAFTLFQHEILTERIFDETVNKSFVSDRSVIDNFAYYANSELSISFTDKTFQAYELICKMQALEGYTHLFLVPMKFKPEPDGVRDTSYRSQVIIEYFIRGFCDKWKIGYWILEGDSLEDRVKEVLSITQHG